MRDVAVKAVDAFLDGNRMKGVLQRRLPCFLDGSLTIGNCAVDYVRYKTKVRRKNPFFCVCYRLEVTDTRSQRHGEQMLYAEVYREGFSRLKFDELMGSQRPSPRF